MITEATENEMNRGIAGKAFRGVIWNFVAYGLGKGIILVSTSILARLLSKTDFGLAAIALVAINYLSVVKNLGLGVALIQRRENVDEAANTVFTMNLIMGILLSAIVFPLAPLLAIYFKDPGVTPVLRWLGISFAINALGEVHEVFLMRDLNYKRKLISDVGGAVTKGVVGIGMAYLGFGVWSLVAAQILSGFVSVIIDWIIVPWRPRLMIHQKLMGPMLKFGASVTGIDMITMLTDNLDYVIVGRVFGLATLSVYTLAYRLPEMLLIGNLWVMGAVIYPAFSSIQDRIDAMRRGFLASVRIVELFAVPISLGLFLAADPVIRVLFGSQWLDAIPVLRVLAIYAWMYSIGYHIGSVYKAIGRPDILLKLSILSVIILVPSLLIGSRFGIIGIGWGLLFAIIFRRIISITMAIRFIHVTLWDIANELKPALLGAIPMSVATLAALYLTANVNPFIRLGIVVLSGAASYLGTLWWFEKENLIQLVRTVLERGTNRATGVEEFTA